MSLKSKVEKIECQIFGNDKEPTLCKFLKNILPEWYIPADNGEMINLRQLFFDKLPHIGPINVEQIFNVLPSKFRAELIQTLKQKILEKNSFRSNF